MKICSKCGRENDNNSPYCGYCGSPLNEEKENSNTVKSMTVLVGVLAVALIAGGVTLFIKSLNSKPDESVTVVVSESESEPEIVTVLEAEPEPEEESEPEPETHILPRSLPNKFYYYKGHTYGFYDAERLDLNAYWEVVDFCREQGGYLAVINDQAENNYLFELVRENYNKPAFFGYTDESREGKWVWKDGDSNYDNWTVHGQHQPDNGFEYGVEEDYAEFNYGKASSCPNDGTWNDAPFRRNTNTFICEWDFDVGAAQQ